MISALLAAALLGQTIPGSASLLYPCFPEVAEDTPLRVDTHSARYRLNATTARCETLTVFKNTSNRPYRLQLRLPVRGRQVTWAQSQGLTFRADLGSAPLGLNTLPIVRTHPSPAHKAKGVWAESFDQTYVATVAFKAGETKSVSTFFGAPIGRAGLDGAQRMVAYATAGADNWSGPIGQINCSIQYEKGVVLQVYAALPDGSWQVGERGAFWKREQFLPPDKHLLIFTYYPDGFEEIGGKRGGG